MALSPTPSLLDMQQCVRTAFDDGSKALKVNVVGENITGGSLEVSIDDVHDSVAIGNGAGVHVGVTTFNSQNALNVIPLTDVTSNGSSITSVTSSTSDTELLAPNTLRKGAVLFNASNANAYVKFGTGASSSSFTLIMGPNSAFVVDVGPIWLGEINAAWAASNGFMAVTELT